ncbi:hypothetical protein [Ruegeria sp. HKCCD7221]|uniref:hypothetical protein n=1 Tax=Ruegeria sp. HKCCD7221 TaxID=2683009 RepID=UPI0014889244|nr:hypothetical protein [Ruegeria sp. HKCCD7221]
MQKLLGTPKELTERVGFPVSNVRYLIREDMLDHIYMAPGRRNPKIPPGAWERYVDNFTVKACQEGYTGAPQARPQGYFRGQLVHILDRGGAQTRALDWNWESRPG